MHSFLFIEIIFKFVSVVNILQRSVEKAVHRLQIRKVAHVRTVARPVECTVRPV